MSDSESNLTRRKFLTCSLGAFGACAAMPALAAPIYRGRDYPVQMIPGITSEEGRYTLKPAKYWHVTGSRVQCTLCPKYCQLSEGQSGPCRIRVNKHHKLWTTVNGSPCVVVTNSIEQGPIYHVLPGARMLAVGTAGCNLRCEYCQNWQYSQTTAGDTKNFDLPPDKLAALAKEQHCRGLLFAFTEPLMSIEYTADCARAARKAGLRTTMITAGWVDEEPLAELVPLFDAIRIDLKSFDEKFYCDVVAGTMRPVLNAAKTVNGKGCWLELVNMVVAGMNDDPARIKKMAEWIKHNVGAMTPLHITRFYPAYKLRNMPASPVSVVTKLREVAKSVGLQYVYVGNCPGNEGENTYCHHCHKELIRRIGYVAIAVNNIVGGRCKFCHTKIPGVWT